ncbi:hypothetical protein LTR66_016174 [Elasticomyces elasticus]|nr:hypothetical protein LTR66_016174 [Elasticomyces elasticus]
MTAMSTKKMWAVVAGVGPGTGASVARTFAKTYTVALLARNPANYEPLVKEIQATGSKAVGISTDTSDGSSVIAAFEKLMSEEGFDGHLAAAVYNVGGKFIRKSFLELSQDEFEMGWQTNGLGGYHFSQAVLPLLLETEKASPQFPPTLIFTSATAAIRGGANFASFATGKFAMRALSQSLAREFGPKSIHVVHAIIDGIIDIERTKEWKVDAPDGKISPQAIADAYWHLHSQPRTSFTYEFDIRPYAERW